MASFIVEGPFAIPTTKMKVGKVITKENIKDFWLTQDRLAGERGCYLFGFRAAKGSKPIYVGKATKTFKQECFTDHKMKKYGHALANQGAGTAIMYFVCLKKTKGVINKTAIDEAESYLIQAGLVANKNLMNDRKTKPQLWSISGVVRSKGKPSNAAAEIKKFLKL